MARTNWARMAVATGGGGTGTLTLEAVSGYPTFTQKHGSGTTAGLVYAIIGTNVREHGTASFDGTALTLSGRTVTESWASGTFGTSAVDAPVGALVVAAVTADELDDIETAIAGKAATSHTHGAGDIVSGTIGTGILGSGTADNTTFLRGDNTWATPAGAGDVVGPASSTAASIPKFADTSGKLLAEASASEILAAAGLTEDDGIVWAQLHVPDTLATGDGQAYLRIPSSYNAWDLVAAEAGVLVAGTTGAITIQIHNVTQAADMLTTPITIDASESDSSTAAAAVPDTSNDDVATGDLIRVDIDAVRSGTAAEDLFVNLGFKEPAA